MRYVIVRRGSGDVEVTPSDSIPPRSRVLSVAMSWHDAIRHAEALRNAR
jgi:hypothetical protein